MRLSSLLRRALLHERVFSPNVWAKPQLHPQIRVVRAPHVKLVQGCIDLAYAWPDTPEVGRDFASSNITARNDVINGFLQLGRTWFGTVEVGRE